MVEAIIMTGEQAVDTLYDRMSASPKLSGFDPTIIIAAIQALIAMLTNKKKQGYTNEQIEECYGRKSRLTKIQLKLAMANEEIPIRYRDKLADELLTMDVTPSEFKSFMTVAPD